MTYSEREMDATLRALGLALKQQTESRPGEALRTRQFQGITEVLRGSRAERNGTHQDRTSVWPAWAATVAVAACAVLLLSHSDASREPVFSPVPAMVAATKDLPDSVDAPALVVAYEFEPIEVEPLLPQFETSMEATDNTAGEITNGRGETAYETM